MKLNKADQAREDYEYMSSTEGFSQKAVTEAYNILIAEEAKITKTIIGICDWCKTVTEVAGTSIETNEEAEALEIAGIVDIVHKDCSDCAGALFNK